MGWELLGPSRRRPAGRIASAARASNRADTVPSAHLGSCWRKWQAHLGAMDRSSNSNESSVKQEGSTALNADSAGHGADTARTEPLVHEPVTRSIIGAFYTVYDKLGFGFLENVYCGALTIELRRRGHKVAREVSVPVFYDGIQIAKYRLDFLVDDLIVLEVKSTALLNPSDQRQLLNCLCATKFEVGLLLHFGPKPK